MSIEGIPVGDEYSQALHELADIQQSIFRTGAYEVEPNIIADIRRRLEAMEITPQQAIDEARAFIAQRQDYH